MDNDPGAQQGSLDPRVYFAAERTLLAWVRTGLAMMGFGFVVARFGLFLRELAALPNGLPHRRFGLSLWVGATLVILGVATNASAALKHWHTVRLLERGQRLQFSPWSLEMVMAAVLAVLGLVMVGYLMMGV